MGICYLQHLPSRETTVVLKLCILGSVWKYLADRKQRMNLCFIGLSELELLCCFSKISLSCPMRAFFHLLFFTLVQLKRGVIE